MHINTFKSELTLLSPQLKERQGAQQQTLEANTLLQLVQENCYCKHHPMAATERI